MDQTLGTISKIILFTFFVGGMNCCVQEKQQPVPSIPSWSSLDPLSIPLRQRLSQYEKGNLVKNPSFEFGKTFNLDSLNVSFNVYNWKKEGDNVYWVNTEWDSLYQYDEAFTGIRSIKIQRDFANETSSQGEGIMSDYIKVIQGNYTLTYYIRLENIYPSQSRRGTKIFDDIDIRILFYDKNKLLIDGQSYFPQKDLFIDNSFKGFSFSNVSYIKQFRWAKVIGRTYHYPFSEGDIPDEAKYVRIFLGLKGTGTMWIDQIDFRYSKWNFSTLERLEPLFDSTFSKTDLLLPIPKTVEVLEPLIYYTKSDTLPEPLILTPYSPAKQTMLAAKLVKGKLDSVFTHQVGEDYNGTIAIVKKITQQDIKSGRLIFSIGKNYLFQRYKSKLIYDKITDHQQGYLIQPDSSFSNLVFLAGSQPIGDYYAATTAIQLIDDSSFVYNQAIIHDYPDFHKRSYFLSRWDSLGNIESDVLAAKEYSKLKLNQAYVGYLLPNGKKDWYYPSPLYKKGIRTVGMELRNMGTIDLAQMVNPYFHFEEGVHIDSLSEVEKNKWIHSNNRNINQLFSVYNLGLKAGAKTITLCTNDYIPYREDYRKIYSLYSTNDINRFGDLQNAHAFLINRIYSWLKANRPATKLEFVPPWYHNELINQSQGRAEQYFNDLLLQIPEDVTIIWTGITGKSLSIDQADLYHFTNLTDRYPMLWDNSLYARSSEGYSGGYAEYYPGKVRMCNLFEPYDIMLPDTFYRLNDNQSLFVNGKATGEIARIKLATVADYLWNTPAYDPDFSFWKALLTRYGKCISMELIFYNEAYFGLTSICMLMEKQGVNNRLLKQGEDYINAMDSHMKNITGKLSDSHELTMELKDYTNSLIGRFNSIRIQYPQVEVTEEILE